MRFSASPWLRLAHRGNFRLWAGQLILPRDPCTMTMPSTLRRNSLPCNKNPFQQSYITGLSKITIIADHSDVERAKDVISSHRLIAVDCEGVDLGRKGSICNVQIATPSHHCFIFDLLGSDSPSVVGLLKSVLHNSSTVKIMHGSKFDADALKHLHGITIVGIHDTQTCDNLLRGCGEKSLNNVLLENGFRTIGLRDTKVYGTNPSFWATRPMTTNMIEWAASDVMSLFQLYDMQVGKASQAMRVKFNEASYTTAEKIRGMTWSEVSFFFNLLGGQVEWLFKLVSGAGYHICIPSLLLR
jgi:hypothetical protein